MGAGSKSVAEWKAMGEWDRASGGRQKKAPAGAGAEFLTGSDAHNARPRS
jgi:hypothetical protein